MQNKKRMLKRMALIGLAVVFVSGLVFLIAQSLREDAMHRGEAEQQSRRQELISKYRAYLTETAKRIKSVPVDQNLIGQAQARYFDEYQQAHLYLWAMDSRGEFAFGVPNEDFARLNAAYDKYKKQIQDEGRFTDRQDFIRRLVNDNRDLDFSRYEREAADQRSAGSWRPWEGDDGAAVFSTPFQNERGEMLGNLYLKVSRLNTDTGQDWNRHEGPMAVSAIILGGSLLFLWFLLPTWVYLDAYARGMQNPARWAALTLVSFVFGFCVYLILRPEDGSVLCEKCGGNAGAGTFCPYCGAPVQNEFCAQCGYPTKSEWRFCPNCQASTRPASPESGGQVQPATSE